MTYFSEIIKKDSFIKFKINDIDKSVVNSIRRIILSEIPCIAFDNIKFIKNNTVFHNEFLSKRLELVPIYFNDTETDTFKSEDYKFIINKKNDTNTDMNITSKDIEIYKNGIKIKESDRLFPFNKITKNYILLTKLKPNKYNITDGEELNIEMYAKKDIAIKHSKFCPVSQSTFYNSYDENNKDILNAQRNYKKNMYDEPSEFVFMIETENGLKPNYLFWKALDILISKVNNLYKNINTNKFNIVNLGNLYQLDIKKETHTLVDVVQALIYNKYFRNMKNTKNVELEFIGYFQMHPDNDYMTLKLKLYNNVDPKKFMLKNLKDIENLLKVYQTSWTSFSGL